MSQKKIALVTGSAKGLGKALLWRLAQNGFIPILHYQSSKVEAENFLAELQNICPEAQAIQADINQMNEVERLFQMIDNQYNRLDVLINNVGNYLKKDILDTSMEEWNEMIQNNLNAVFYTSKSAIRLMQKNKYGRIINVGYAGVGQIKAEPTVTPYFIAKTGALILTKSLAQSLANQNINVNMVSPGVLENSISKPIHEIPKGRLAALTEFVEVVDFLLSEKADYLTGTHIEVAGGWRL
jgi:NAD(P)-dependent dehydrogenase (short-subunit alcohol dehydrogenase family)